MQALKALVIIMGVMIFAGMGLLVYGLMTRVSGEDDSARVAAAEAFGKVSATLPAGAEVRVFDLATGAATGSIELKAAP